MIIVEIIIKIIYSYEPIRIIITIVSINEDIINQNEKITGGQKLKNNLLRLKNNMFNVIRLPTKFSRTIKRFSQIEKAELLGLLIIIWDWESVNIPDNIVWDTVSLIYGEWMNMESKNGNKPKDSLIQYPSELVGTKTPSNPTPRVEENRIEENIIENISKDISTEVEEFWNEQINNMQELIKQTIESNWMIYKAWKYERPRIKNILTGKDFWEICEKVNMSREDFVINIINLATKLKYTKKINNWADLYANYATVYNKWLETKNELLQPKILREIW